MFIQIHAIHSVPPSCINRDDVGAVKSAVYGGVRRHRVSSQSWKRAMRTYVADNGLGEIGTRTTALPGLIADSLGGDYDRSEAVSTAAKVCNAAGLSTKKVSKDDVETHKTEVLAFVSPSELDVLTDITRSVLGGEKVPSKKDVKARLDDASVTPDIALFGRMVASEKGLNVDACAQVAHAISTHESQPELDFYTAVDDVTTDSEGGSGHMGSNEFASSTLIRYASIDVDRLRDTIGADAARSAVSAFVTAFVRSMPTGKSTTFANTTLPDYVLIEYTDAPVSYVGAFEDPVRARGNLVGSSIDALESYRERVGRVYGQNPEFIIASTADDTSATLDDAAAWAGEHVTE